MAGLLTIAAVVGSAFIYSPGIGYGGWLMATIPLSPLIYLFIKGSLFATTALLSRR